MYLAAVRAVCPPGYLVCVSGVEDGRWPLCALCTVARGGRRHVSAGRNECLRSECGVSSVPPRLSSFVRLVCHTHAPPLTRDAVPVELWSVVKCTHVSE